MVEKINKKPSFIHFHKSVQQGLISDKIRDTATTTYMSHDGQQISGQKFMEHLFGDLGNMVTNEDDIRAIWSDPERSKNVMLHLKELCYIHTRS